MITPDDIKKRFSELLLRQASHNPAAGNDVLGDLLQYMAEDVGGMTPDAKKLHEKMIGIIIAGFRDQIKQVPDSPTKRQFERLLWSYEDNYPTAAQLIDVLGSKNTIKSEILADGNRLFEPVLQSILDLLQDASHNSQKGGAGFAKITLLFSCAQELTVAFHLAQRAFTNQTYAHIRTVFEVCDKIDLFHLKPEEVSKWADAKKWEEFLPSNVRKKLGKPSYDPVYSMFSKLGPHGTFEGVQLFTGKTVEKEETETPTLNIWVGGCHRNDQLIMTHGIVLISALMIIFRICEVYRKELHVEEVERAMLGAVNAVIEFDEKHLFPWAKENGKDIAELQKWIEDKRQIWSKWHSAWKADQGL